MNLMKLANPLHVARETVGLAGTVAGAAATVVGRTAGAARDAVHRAATTAEETNEAVRTSDGPRSGSRQAGSHQAERPLPGADTVEFPPAPPAEPPVDVVGAALSGEEGPVTAGGALVEPEGPEPDDQQRP